MRRHLLMDPSFPDLVAQLADVPADSDARYCANDNSSEPDDGLGDPLLAAFAELDVAATRLW